MTVLAAEGASASIGVAGFAGSLGGLVVEVPALSTGADKGKGRSIGAALELAVRAAVTSQKKNSYGGWRYSPDSNDADTSVSGAVLVGLLAARKGMAKLPRVRETASEKVR